VDVLRIAGHGPYLKDVWPTVRIIELGVSHVNSSLFPLMRYLKAQRPRALLTDKDRVNRVALLARCLSHVPVRTVVRIGTTVSRNLSRRSPAARLTQQLSMRYLYPHADAIILPSRGAAEDLQQFADIPESKTWVIPSPVSGDFIQRMSQEPIVHPWLRHNPGQERDIPVILGAGELCARKDFTTLIRAFCQVRRQRSCRLIILGKGRQREALLTLTRELGIADDVFLPGFVNNPYAFMHKADVFVLSSTCEGAPVVLMEALAVGVPVVSTDCPSGPSEILQNGRIGPLVPVGDSDALAAAVMQMLAHPPDMAQLQAAAQRYSIEESASRYLAALGL
jgi:glycosyltransferase involved in cell wall biosynthesis